MSMPYLTNILIYVFQTKIFFQVQNLNISNFKQQSLLYENIYSRCMYGCFFDDRIQSDEKNYV
jgi:hypothetical protein